MFIFLRSYYYASNYALARQKLKQVEDLSDLSSNTEREEYLKKSRKIRAAKNVSSDSHNETSDEDLSSQFPKIPQISKDTKEKIVKDARKGKNTGKH